MSKTDTKKRSVQRKVYFYKVICMVDGIEIKMDTVFDLVNL